MEQIILKEKAVPVKGKFDVIVCGGGPAGFAAALAAGRRGASTLLIESGQCCGGVWTAGAMPWFLDHRNKTGILAELREIILRRGGMIHVSGSLSCPPEELKLILEELLLEADVRIRYGTLVTDAVTCGRELTTVITDSKAGREAWRAARFIDCTGDGDLGALAGCSFDFGGPDGKTQPSSFIGIVGGLDPEAIGEFLAPNGGKPRLKTLMESHGVFPSYGMPTLFHFGMGVFGLMSNHGYNADALDPDVLTRQVVEGRREVHRHVNFLRSLGGIWKDIVLVATSSSLGIREGGRPRAPDRSPRPISAPEAAAKCRSAGPPSAWTSTLPTRGRATSSPVWTRERNLTTSPGARWSARNWTICSSRAAASAGISFPTPATG